MADWNPMGAPNYAQQTWGDGVKLSQPKGEVFADPNKQPAYVSTRADLTGCWSDACLSLDRTNRATHRLLHLSKPRKTMNARDAQG